ncbi:accessory Sec system protein Asp2 [Macrococcoides goetzii]|uniref:Accessory Sec system protein Asp2 n=1 Tax=Macrococcoides goetzii TaxID=1891097 RepID=A0A2G5NU64_9STAP|nr:accessory Sec system protein Asp2 [Macrococcus goetzii]RAI78918.1 accessory Sec system protein Asp2 [Macrococcus goetzii]
MKRQFRILQIGNASLENRLGQTGVKLDFLDANFVYQEQSVLEEIYEFIAQQKAYQIVLIEAPASPALLHVIELVAEPFNLYVKGEYWDDYRNQPEITLNFACPVMAEDEEAYIHKLKTISYNGQYGDKIHAKFWEVRPSLQPYTEHLGNKWLTVDVDCPSWTPIASLRKLLYYEGNHALEIWPEFKTEGVQLEFTFRVYQSGTVDNIIETFKTYSEDMTEPIVRPMIPDEGYVSVTVKAKGNGKVFLGAVHRRWSRLEFGRFLPGGQVFADQHRDEFIYLFHPGDMKPPLNVYFSGYRSAEGFEGYFMMLKMGAPFLLIGDPRIEGGGFYLGSEAYESGIKQVIADTLETLGFADDELILSGLSMGSFGAIYYGAQLNPQAVIVGKPLVNVGTIGENMRLMRPEEFGTALDVLLTNTGGTTNKHVKALDDKFWTTFEQHDISRTTFAICYMEDDDYDLYAFDELLPVLSAHHAKVISRGIPGRHNDDSPTINNWFINFYHILMESKFGRV